MTSRSPTDYTTIKLSQPVVQQQPQDRPDDGRPEHVQLRPLGLCRPAKRRSSPQEQPAPRRARAPRRRPSHPQQSDPCNGRGSTRPPNNNTASRAPPRRSREWTRGASRRTRRIPPRATATSAPRSTTTSGVGRLFLGNRSASFSKPQFLRLRVHGNVAFRRLGVFLGRLLDLHQSRYSAPATHGPRHSPERRSRQLRGVRPEAAVRERAVQLFD